MMNYTTINNNGIDVGYSHKAHPTMDVPEAAKIADTTTRENSALMPTPQETAATQLERITDLLRSYNMKATEENIAMLKNMVENGIPLTKENIQKMNQAMKLTQNAEKALFLMQNNMRLTQANVAQLDGLVSGQFRITNQINHLLAAIDGLADKALVAQLRQILNHVGQGQTGAQSSGVQTAGAEYSPQRGEMLTQQAQVTVPSQSQPAQATPGSSAPMPETVKQQNTVNQTTAGTAQTMQTGVPQHTSIQTTPETGIHTNTQSVLNEVSNSTPGQSTPLQQGQMNQTPTQQTSNATQPQTNQAQMHQMPNAVQTQQQPLSAEQSLLHQQQSQPTATSESSTQATPQPTPPTTSQSPTLPQNLTFNPFESTPQDIDHFINNLRTALTQIQQQLGDTPDAARVMQEVRILESHIEFTAQIRDQIFIQLPLSFDGHQTLTSLHVYKDGKKSASGGGSGETSSASIALETAGMGHFETYVQKNARSVHCQFRLENAEIVKTVRDNIHKLDALLKDSNYALDSFTFLPPDEPYTLLDDPKKFDPNNDIDLHLSDDTLHYNRLL